MIAEVRKYGHASTALARQSVVFTTKAKFGFTHAKMFAQASHAFAKRVPELQCVTSSRGFVVEYERLLFFPLLLHDHVCNMLWTLHDIWKR